MENRRRFFIIIGAVIVIALVVFLFWWLFVRQPSQNLPAGNTNGNGNFSDQLPVSKPIIVEPKNQSPVSQPDVEATMKTVARTFAERFGSFSSETNFSSLEDARSLMTQKMYTSAKSYIASQLAKYQAGSYYGITTVALSAKITAYDAGAGQATAVVSTQRREAKISTANPRIFYQTLHLTLVSNQGGWQVDQASWQ